LKRTIDLNPEYKSTSLPEAVGGYVQEGLWSAVLIGELTKHGENENLADNDTRVSWSQEFELRDREIIEHTQRVTQMTLKLARLMNVQEEEIGDIYRGALLHDIGKIDIPSEILYKPGPLTDEEWVVMRQHPVLAYELLSSIPALQSAIDIPYCHHEKWNGTGYPRGLKGDEIPLAARIFAVVDVWDALTSDRPYRKALPPEQVIEFILEESGQHFDAQVVDAFMILLTADQSPRTVISH
jgi:putative nucleotidyltransferase with HDIG domain